ncbi:MoxR family ATPase [Compostibacter hankyongensis]|uniref:MoxR family ATPase n=1 Tax=Compostibacter hankyongensis TaxID=1007089 RepID=A0ABP8FFH5_9BACT
MEESQPSVTRTDLSRLSAAVQEIKREMARVIVGQEAMIELLIAAVLADGHVLIEGVPGVAKTLAAKLLAQTLDIRFSRIQFTPDLMPSDVLGTAVFNPQHGEFQFKPGPVFSNIVLIDEINRAPAKTQAALFEVMEERQVTMDNRTYPMAAPFLVLATQNPVEHEGTYRLPEAQLDRFLFKIAVDYPALEDEVRMLEQFQARGDGLRIPFEQVSRVLQAADILALRSSIHKLHIEQPLIAYIARIVYETRHSRELSLGASPRASLALLQASKAFAAIRDRDFVTPEDIVDTAPSVLRHRVAVTPEKEMEGVTADEIIVQLLKKTEVPR